MAKNILYICTFVFNFIVIYAAISAFDDVLDDVSTCEEKCMKLYGASNVSGSESIACSRGCRLYTITRFITADEPSHTNTIDDDGLSPAKLLCQHSCTEAYNETSSSTRACKAGCDMEEAATIKKEKVEEDNGPSIHLLKPLMEIREVTSKVMGMLRIVQTSLITYFMREDNSVVAVEGPVHVMVQLNPNAAELDDGGIRNIEAQETAQNSVLKEKINHAFASEGSRIEFVSRKLSCLMVISVVIFFVILFAYILVVSCCKRDKNLKLKEIQEISNKLKHPIPVHAMPVKLVRPEDLSKLSLMDEEDVKTHARNRPSCSFCINHGKKEMKRNHKCFYGKECSCILCTLTRKVQTVTRHQRRVWRFKNQINKVNDVERYQKCDNCQNHQEFVRKSNHDCPRENCQCDLCALSRNRHNLMKHLQRARKLGVTQESTCETGISVAVNNLTIEEDPEGIETQEIIAINSKT